MKKIGLLNGPNLDRLGKREPDIYGSETLEEIVQKTQSLGTTLGCEVHAFQSNHEGSLIDQIHQWADLGFSGLIINPGGFTHTSVAIRDALLGVGIPFIEVHLSNVHAREPFRQHSYLSDKAVGVICGLGPAGYRFALDAADQQLAASA